MVAILQKIPRAQALLPYFKGRRLPCTLEFKDRHGSLFQIMIYPAPDLLPQIQRAITSAVSIHGMRRKRCKIMIVGVRVSK